MQESSRVRSQSKNQGRALKILLPMLMAQLVIRHLLPALPDLAADFIWYASDVLRAVGMATALGLCATLTPWRMLRLKCLLVALCGYYMSDAALCLTWYAWQTPSILVSSAIQGASFLLAAIYYWQRSYVQPSDDLKDGYLYCVRHIPFSPQDFLISMSGMYGPNGGYSLFANGYLYKFSGGRLVRRKVSTLPAISYHVTRGEQLDSALISRLDGMIGMRWSLNKNCLTVLGRIWREHSGRAY